MYTYKNLTEILYSTQVNANKYTRLCLASIFRSTKANTRTAILVSNIDASASIFRSNVTNSTKSTRAGSFRFVCSQHEEISHQLQPENPLEFSVNRLRRGKCERKSTLSNRNRASDRKNRQGNGSDENRCCIVSYGFYGCCVIVCLSTLVDGLVMILSAWSAISV